MKGNSLYERHPDRKRQITGSFLCSISRNMQPIRFCNQYAALGQHVISLSYRSTLAIASQDRLALITNVQVAAPFVLAFKINQQVCPTDFDFMNDGFQITGKYCVVNRKYFRSAHLP